MSLLNKFKKTVRQYNLIDRRDKIVIGLSGGADSVALTLLLKSLCKERRLSLHIAHLNHSLRANASKQDADFVLQLAQKLNLPVTLREINVAKFKQKGSLEEIARKVRLDFLFEAAKKFKAKKIALGHNLDDQAETVLMRVIRGSGLLGLSGILPKRKIGDFIIIRPLLEISRREIESFLRAKRIKPRVDYTNRQEIYFRNLIRHRLIPKLSQYNPNIKEVLASTAENIAIDYEYLLKEGLRAFERLSIGKAKSKMEPTRAKARGSCGRNTQAATTYPHPKGCGFRPRSIKLPLAKLLKLHLSMQHMVLRFSYKALKGDMRRLTYQHIKELKDLVYNRPLGSIVDLPSQISVIKNPQALCVYPRTEQPHSCT